MSNEVKAYGAKDSKADLEPMTIKRREILEDDVEIDITYCGVCHSDIHTVHNDWGNAVYPMIPGHEIIGRVSAIGENVSDFEVDQLVGVGCMVDSCQTCASCKDDLEQFCEKGPTMTYGSKDKHMDDHTHGGYTTSITVNKKFVLNIPENLEEKGVAPLLCAGITTFSPLNNWNVKKGDKVGIIGLGGLGHIGVKFADAMGAHVVMITTSPKKADDAERLGADEVLISKDKDAMKEHANSFDFILNTIPVGHKIDPYLTLLKRDATMVLVGSIEPLDPFNGGGLIMGRKRVAGSFIGGVKETQEMLDFCGKHNIVSDIEVIEMKDINKAFDRVMDNDVKYRFVIDMASMKN